MYSETSILTGNWQLKILFVSVVITRVFLYSKNPPIVISNEKDVKRKLLQAKQIIHSIEVLVGSVEGASMTCANFWENRNTSFEYLCRFSCKTCGC